MTSTLTQRTITGPVERPLARLLRRVPLTPARPPNNPANSTITPRRLVHCRAAAAGATTMALINTTPTACRPMTMAMTRRAVTKISIPCMG